EDGIRDLIVTGVQTCALPIYAGDSRESRRACLIFLIAELTPVSTSTNTSLLHSWPTISLRDTRRPRWWTSRIRSSIGCLASLTRSEERRVGKECRYWCEGYPG